MKIALLPFYLELYDQVRPENRAPLQGFVDEVAAQLEKLSFEVYKAPVCRLKDEFASAVKDIEDSGSQVIATLHLAYSPSLEAADVLAKTALPIVVLDTTPAAAFNTLDGTAIMQNHGIHGVQDLCNLLLRLKKPFLLAAGHWQNKDFLREVSIKLHAATMAYDIKGMRVGTLGGEFAGMGDFQIPEGTFGIERVQYTEQAEADNDEIAAEIAADLERFTVAEDLDAEAHKRTIKASLKLRKWLEAEKLNAFTVCFPGINLDSGWATVPFLECSKAMARGIGYAGEGDVLTAAVNGCLMNSFPETSFTEMFCPDWEGNRIFTSHMGEINVALLNEKAFLYEMPYQYSNTGNPVVASGCFKSGKAVLTNLAPGPDNTFTLISANVEFSAQESAEKRKNSGWFSPKGIDIARFLKEYSKVGGTHHLACSYKASTEILKYWAKLMNWNYVNLC